MPRTSRTCRPDRTVARPLLLLLGFCLGAFMGIVTGAAHGARFEPSKAYPDGWDASVEFGAQATSGASRTSSISGAAEMTYRGGRWENLFTLKALHSSSSVRVYRRDERGEKVTDEVGRPVSDIVRDRTNDRRFFAMHSRWYFQADRTYLFALVDAETNEPADIDISVRHIGGVGHRLLHDKSNYFTTGVGVGRKRLVQVSGDTETGSIGYVGLNFVRLIGERVTFEAGIDSDFGGENRYTEFTLGLTWRLSEPVSLKFAYEARHNSDISNPGNPFDDSLDARSSVSLEIDVL